MLITSAKFLKGLVGPDETLEDGKRQVALVGRSNVGKSSLLNSLTHTKNLARTSSTPGRTQELNLFLINKSTYLVDLPGYGFAKASREKQAAIQDLIYWYLFESTYERKKVVLIIDSKIGPTAQDKEMFKRLNEQKTPVVIVANKIDKVKKADYAESIAKIKEMAGDCLVIPYSSVKKTGLDELARAILR